MYLFRNVNIHLYGGLTPEEARALGNQHNGSQSSLKPTFQVSSSIDTCIKLLKTI